MVLVVTRSAERSRSDFRGSRSTDCRHVPERRNRADHPCSRHELPNGRSEFNYWGPAFPHRKAVPCSKIDRFCDLARFAARKRGAATRGMTRGMRPLHLFRLAPALGANAVEDDTRTRPSREIEAHLCARHVKNIRCISKRGAPSRDRAQAVLRNKRQQLQRSAPRPLLAALPLE